ncbi:transposase [Paraburkholderia sediminicola]
MLAKIAPRHTSARIVAFLTRIVSSQQDDQEIHVACDNVSRNKTRTAQAFQVDHPNVTLHCTPTCSSWLNQTESGSHI